MNSKQQARRAKAGNPIKRAVRLVRNSMAGEQTATELLKSQHDEVKALFKKIEKASTRAQKTKLFEEMASKLVGHDAIEREIFYPACEKGMGMVDLLGEALVEHGVVEFSLFQAEEDEFFPKVQRALGREKLVELGARMKARFEETQAEDFRAPLHQNLNQVLAGALKTGKRRPAKRRAA